MKGRIPKTRRNKRIRAINDTRIEQYGIRSVDDICHNTKAISAMRKWLTTSTGNKHGLFIQGPSGCGKTTVTKIICESEGYDVKYFNGALYGKSSKCKDVISIEDFVREASRCNNVLLSMMQPDKTKPRITIIDQIDQYLAGSGSKVKLTSLKNMLTSTRNRVILIAADINSKVKIIAKQCTTIRFNRPTTRELGVIIDRFCDRTGMKLTIVSKIYIQNKIDQDIRQLLIVLYELYKLYYNTTTINLDQLQCYLSSNNIKDLGDSDIFKFTEKIMFANDLSISDKLCIYDKFPYKLPIFMQENVLRSTNDWQKIMVATEQFSDADLISSAIFDRMDSEMYVARYIYGIIAIIPPYLKRNDQQYQTYMKQQWNSIDSIINIAAIEGESASFTLSHPNNRTIMTSGLFGSSNTQRANHDSLIAIRTSSCNRFADIDTFSYGGHIIRHRIETNQLSEVVRLAREYGFHNNRKYDTKKIAELMYDIATKLYFSKINKTKPPKKIEINKLVTEFERQDQEHMMERFNNLMLTNNYRGS